MFALVAGLTAFSVRLFFGLAGLVLRRLESRVENRVAGEVHGDVIQIGVVQGDLTICSKCDHDQAG